MVEAIKLAGIRNYSICHAPTLNLLIAHFEYVGDDFAADMQTMAQNPEILQWWEETDPLQSSLIEGAKGSRHGPWCEQGQLLNYGIKLINFARA